ncbi:hypothetical protein CONPUDRAFT_169527, partial [Coniophora puteana RWD-64-598 SS2]
MPRQLPPPSASALSRMLYVSDQRTAKRNSTKPQKPTVEALKEQSNTVKRAVRAFTDYCDAYSVPADARLPASELLLVLYASEALLDAALSNLEGPSDPPVEQEQGQDAKSQIAALRAWHAHNGAVWRGGEQPKLVLRGLDNIVNRARADARQSKALTGTPGSGYPELSVI